MRTNQLQHSFQTTPSVNIPRSSFNRSHGHKTTFDAGYLIPIYVDEVLPGDTHNVEMSFFARLSTPLAPIMDNIHLESHFFFVPNRLVWENFQKFMGEKDDPSSSTQYVVPQLDVSSTHSALEGSLFDYMGLPTKIGTTFSVNALPFRAYWKIYDEWFRDQNLKATSGIPKDDGPDTSLEYYLLNPSTTAGGLAIRNKQHDYFTSCLPWPQKGDEVSVPIGTSAPIKYDTFTGTTTPDGKFAQIWQTSGGATAAYFANAAGGPLGTVIPNSSGHDLYADLTNAASATINDLREAFAIQAHYEKDARGGTRYTEIIRSHFGVISPDARLQRPEYLGGSRSYVNISPIAQTNDNVAGGRPLGSLGATGIVSGTGHGFVKSFTEHGFIIGLVSARADVTYQEGLNRMWSRSTRFDYYWPSLAHLGEQSVLNKEIFMSGTSATDEAVFGYIPRYDEYRHKPSMVTGIFRSNATASLDHWHLGEDYSATPTLNNTFIQDKSRDSIDRVIAVPSEPQIIFDSYFKVTSVRPMPTYGTPGLRL